MNFVLENEVYDLLKRAGIKTPKYAVIHAPKDIDQAPFSPSEEIVFKGIASNVWHKSDIGLVQFSHFNKESIQAFLLSMPKSLNEDQAWHHGLAVEKISFKKNGTLPSEIFFSLKRDPSCGWILLWGFGGVQSEFWGKYIPPCAINLSGATAESINEKIRQHPLTDILLGTARGTTALLTNEKLIEFFSHVLKLPAVLDSETLDLLEVNPLVVNQQSELIPLDGVGQRSTATKLNPIDSRNLSFDKLFHPKSVGIVGLSTKPGSPTNIIYDNLQNSDCQIVVIRDPKELLTSPVDILIVGINARNTFELIQQLFKQGGGAEYLYLVTGGIADGSDHGEIGDALLTQLHERRKQNLWTPTLIGPNGLGLVSTPIHLNSLFIPQNKLPLPWPKNTITQSTAIISQSGAYLITRLSQDAGLMPRYAISIGSKMDLKIPDLLRMFEQVPTIKTIGLYVEGFDPEEALETIKVMRSTSKTFIVYKGGRSALGAKAAQSHTGAMMTDFGVLQSTFDVTNVSLTNSFVTWTAQLLWRNAYPGFSKRSKWGFITNAGYESVGSGDFAITPPQPLDSSLIQRLQKIIKTSSLQDLVSPANPLDLTPMANEGVWVACAEAFLDSDIEVLLLGIVPLTPRLETNETERVVTFVESLQELKIRYKKQIGVILDCGPLYDSYKGHFKNAGLPVFTSIEEAMSIFK